FAQQPTLTFTSTDHLTKNFGTTVNPTGFSVSGLQSGVAGAYLADSNAGVFSGAPSLSSAGAASTASAAGSPYVIAIGAGSLNSLDRYAFAFNSAGTITVNPEPAAATPVVPTPGVIPWTTSQILAGAVLPPAASTPGGLLASINPAAGG